MDVDLRKCGAPLCTADLLGAHISFVIAPRVWYMRKQLMGRYSSRGKGDRKYHMCGEFVITGG